MTTSRSVGEALDKMFARETGLYGTLEDLPIISQKGHYRRTELLARLDIGDVTAKTCVDFGMGSWGFASIYPRLHQCARAIGIDISAHALDLSRKLVAETRPAYADRFETYQSDGMTLPFTDRSVDLFFSGESIEHVRFPPRHLSEIHRALADDGQLVLTTPNRDAVGWRSQGEEYCTSPEHFWLFNYAELTAMVSEFFDICEVYGFNGSFGPGLDRAIKDERRADEWCQQFEHEPNLATDVVLRATKKRDVTARYEIADVSQDAIRITGADQYLPLEFGLQGLLLDRAGAKVEITRPPSDGVCCRFWSHKWSGHAQVVTATRLERVDLYTRVPGWRNWLCADPTTKPSIVMVTPTLERNPKSENAQVIFFESFTWRRTGEGRSPFTAVATAPAPELRGDYPQGDGFSRLQPFISTTLFLWFTPTTGNLRGPWQPIEGRQNWTGTSGFWVNQLKQIMMANIDAIYVHCIHEFEEQRGEFFRAHAQLRRDGWDVPKLAPFLDPFYLWRDAPIDVSTPAGKDEFVRHYVRFFTQYLAVHDDPGSESYLLRIDDRIVLASWWVTHLLRNVETLSRDDVESRLVSALGGVLPRLRNGVHMITAALIDPDLKFSDERVVMFAGYTYAIHSVHNGIDAWHLQAGYWDENIRTPGYMLPREGGSNYRRAWNIAVANKPQRVYIESWNEYDEGSGIYAADPTAPFCDRAMHDSSDVFSNAGDPFEYIRTTADGAARLNGRPAYDAQVLGCEAPAIATRGSSFHVRVQMRNAGNARWKGRDGVGLATLRDDRVVHIERLNDTDDESLLYDGIFRGRPKTFTLMIETGQTASELSLLFRMICGETLFGASASVNVTVQG